MRNLAIVVALAGALVVPDAAFAQRGSDLNAAIRLCRTEVARQSGAGAETIRLDRTRERLSSIRVDLDLWRDGRLQNVRCEVERGQELTIASITPTLQTAAR